MKSIRHIAQQYGGEVTIRTNDHWFVLTVLLPRQTADGHVRMASM